jgi:hypothetical protein
VSSSTSSSDRRALLLGLAGFVVVAAAAEIGLDRFAGRASTNETFLLHRHLEARVTHETDVLFLGDSSVRASIDPQRFEALTNQRATNLGFVSDAGLIADEAFLDAYLSAHPPPSTVVLGHVPDGGIEDFPTALYLDFFPSPASAWRHVGVGELTWVQGVDAVLRSASPTYRHRAYVFGAARPWLLFDLSAGRANLDANATFVADRARLGYFPAAGAFRASVIADRFVLTPPHRRALDRMLARLPASTTCWWLLGPTPEGTRVDFDPEAVRAVLPERVRLLFERPPPLKTTLLARLRSHERGRRRRRHRERRPGALTSLKKAQETGYRSTTAKVAHQAGCG